MHQSTHRSAPPSNPSELFKPPAQLVLREPRHHHEKQNTAQKRHHMAAASARKGAHRNRPDPRSAQIAYAQYTRVDGRSTHHIRPSQVPPAPPTPGLRVPSLQAINPLPPPTPANLDSPGAWKEPSR
ncbi:hypothetical protein PtB15_6B114 [Puccinia triticina]|nr:hypothetical protein PtB15_6B114 [Puccinia triticina]